MAMSCHRIAVVRFLSASGIFIRATLIIDQVKSFTRKRNISIPDDRSSVSRNLAHRMDEIVFCINIKVNKVRS